MKWEITVSLLLKNPSQRNHDVTYELNVVNPHMTNSMVMKQCKYTAPYSFLYTETLKSHHCLLTGI